MTPNQNAASAPVLKLEEALKNDQTKEDPFGGQNNLYDELNGRATLEKVRNFFCDKINADRWMKNFFSHMNQKHIENQQTDFMASAMGGPQNYFGAFPIPAHKHINITDELFTHRTELLRQSLNEAGLPDELAQKWLKIDGAFKFGIVKNSIEDCQKRFFTDEIVDHPNPFKKS